MNKALRIALSVLAAYRLASLVSHDEGPYLPFLYKDERQTGVFEWLRVRLGVYDYGPDGKPETNLARGLQCPLCTGIYFSALLMLLVFLPHKVKRVTDVFLAWMAVAGGQVFLENLTSDEALQSAIEEVAESIEEE